MQKADTPTPPRISCIINPEAANKKWKRNILVRKYIQKNLPGKYFDSPEDKKSTIETTKQLCQNNDIIIAAGGDGTIADVIQGIIESGRSKDVSLGIIPWWIAIGASMIVAAVLILLEMRSPGYHGILHRRLSANPGARMGSEESDSS